MKIKDKMKHSTIRLSSQTFFGLLILAIVFSCGQEKTPVAEAAQAPEVPVQEISNGEGVINNTFPAAIEGVTNVEVRPQTSGYLRQILVDEGAYVKAGQLLFKIDDRPYREQYNTAKATVAAAEAHLKTLKIDLNRKEELVDNKIVSDLQLQQAQAAFEEAQASLEQAKASMNKAKIDLDFCSITAPVSGFIGRIPYRLGSLVNPTSTEPLTLLTDIHEVYGYFSLSEADFTKFQAQLTAKNKSDSVSLLLSDGSIYERKGVIDAITGQFDKNTGSIAVRAKFSNPDQQLRAGNTGKIQLTRTLENALIVPIRATTSVQEKIYVYKVDKDNKIQQVEIKVGSKTTENYYVTSGLQQGDIIVTGNLATLRPDMAITPKKQ